MNATLTGPGSGAEGAPAADTVGAPAGSAAVVSDDPDTRLFGVELVAQVQQRAAGIKLDPTIDRGTFRAQRDRLKEIGYKFDAQAQAWSLAA